MRSRWRRLPHPTAATARAQGSSYSHHRRRHHYRICPVRCGRAAGTRARVVGVQSPQAAARTPVPRTNSGVCAARHRSARASARGDGTAMLSSRGCSAAAGSGILTPMDVSTCTSHGLCVSPEGAAWPAPSGYTTKLTVLAAGYLYLGADFALRASTAIKQC